MRHISVLVLLTIFLFSCEKDQEPKFTVISGKISNPKAETVSINSDRNIIREVAVDKEGVFQDTLQIEPGYYNFSHGRERSSIYLAGDFNLNISLDAEAFDETIKFEGAGSDVNNYLAQKYLYREETIGNSRSHFSLEEVAFKDKLEQMNAELNKRLESSVGSNSTFLELEKQNLEFEFIDALNKYESRHAYYAEKKDFKVSEDFMPDHLKSASFNDATAYALFPSYRSLARNELSVAVSEAIGEDYQNAKAEHFKALTESEIPALKNSYINGTGRFMLSPANPNMVEIYELFMDQLTDEEIRTNISERFEKNKTLLPGMPSPVFNNYENHDGGSTSLEDLRGKYVYIDVWATWCAPCLREVPYLKEVEKEYGKKNIAFVSTSIDVAADHDKWVDMVTEKELEGVQLFADNDWNSAFVKEYGIEGIPRFILVDPEGKIISADAPRPSNDKLKSILEGLKL